MTYLLSKTLHLSLLFFTISTVQDSVDFLLLCTYLWCRDVVSLTGYELKGSSWDNFPPLLLLRSSHFFPENPPLSAFTQSKGVPILSVWERGNERRMRRTTCFVRSDMARWEKSVKGQQRQLGRRAGRKSEGTKSAGAASYSPCVQSVQGEEREIKNRNWTPLRHAMQPKIGLMYGSFSSMYC